MDTTAAFFGAGVPTDEAEKEVAEMHAKSREVFERISREIGKDKATILSETANVLNLAQLFSMGHGNVPAAVEVGGIVTRLVHALSPTVNIPTEKLEKLIVEMADSRFRPGRRIDPSKLN